MSPESWLLVALALALGIGIGVLVNRRGGSEDTVAGTLVPHRTREVLSVLQSGAVIVRRDRRSAFANTTANALGVSRADGALHGGVADLAEKAWKAESPVEDEVEIKRGVLGSSSIVHVRVTPLNDELALAVANDNTEMRAAEATRREFAVNVSHELKTPVGALSLLAETIEDNAEDTLMVEKFAGKIRKETRRLTKLIQEIIEISRLQGGESVMEYETVDLGGVVDEVLEAVHIAADGKRITLVREVTASPIVMGDRDLLVMALRNLVDNAINYSEPAGRVTVALGQEGEIARLAVIDQGLGIATEDQERIFERFYRTDPARSRETGGTGLGLSIVKHVVAQHSGTVHLWSQPSVGSTFTIRLAAEGEAADAAEAAEEES
ncbi:cell wall metabolism sensor histidine kinase WalK [Demequina sp. NBRC 110056]|uniref:sensor histidine kinase n=1 Tax=Demequina sp. NBRC 110056 TaxID=1570345 RepID=UPI000A0359D1|nr:ATP-binding protein [Demequina sp. NBRC 110056]